jgi:hypothetical protein
MIDVPRRFEGDREKFDALPADIAVSRGLCAGEAVEEIVEAAILLHDHDDVLDLCTRAR